MEDMLQEHHILISGSIGDLKGKVIRIGHMGNNANVEDVAATLTALTAVLTKRGFSVNGNMKEIFLRELEV